MTSNRLFLSFYQYHAETTNILVIIMMFVSGQFFLISRRTYYVFNQTSFSMDSKIVSLFFGGDQGEFIKHYYLFTEAKKHGLQITTPMFKKTRNSIPIFWNNKHQFDEKVYDKVKKKHHLSSNSIVNAISIIAIAEEMTKLLNLLPLPVPSFGKVPVFKNQGLLLDMSRSIKKPKIINRNDLNLFFLRNYEDKKITDATGLDVVNGKIFYITNKVTEKDFTISEKNIFKNGNSKQVKEVLHNVLARKNLHLKINETLIQNEKLSNNKIVYEGYYKPGKLHSNSKYTYLFVLDNLKYNVVHEPVDSDGIPNSITQKYYGYLQHNKDILYSIQLVNQYNQGGISLEKLKEKASIIDKIHIYNHYSKNNLTDKIFLLSHCVDKAIFFLDSERRPVIFVPLSQQVTSYNQMTPLSTQTYKQQLLSNMQVLEVVLTPKYFQSIKNTINNLSKDNLGKLKKQFDNMKNHISDNFKSQLWQKNNLFHKQKNRMMFLARKHLYESEVQTSVMNSINVQAGHWYKKTIEPS